MRKTIFKKIGITVSATALASAMVVGSVPMALAATVDSFWTNPESAATVDSNLLTTYGVRAGSAGPDFLGITNTNFDSIGSGAKATTQTAPAVTGVNGSALALWATSVNEAANPYYTNLFLNTLNGNTDASPAATTWSSNPETSAWGDSNNLKSGDTMNGMEYKPDIIFGANKYTNWGNFDAGSTNFGQIAAADSSYNPTFTNNDSTNLWTQIYTLNQLGITADGISGKTTRYASIDGSATESALNYEKALRGNLLYIASQIDTGKAKKKTVAYLYAIDANGTGYFFVPEASGLVKDSDTGTQANGTESTPTDATGSNYAGNNGTIDLDYMDTLPFITNTFTGGTPVDGGIVMKVEDIYKTNPVNSLAAGTANALKDVDVIIYNSTKNTDIGGTVGQQGSDGKAAYQSNGKNESNIDNDYNGDALSTTEVETWAQAMGFGGKVLAGDDWGTSTQQNYGTADTTEDGMSPLLYCRRNYTTDKPARAAWAFSKVYSELYPNADASYSYWVSKVYHVKMASVPTVAQYLTNRTEAAAYTDETEKTLEGYYQTGLDWWVNTGSKKAAWNQYAYYNGSSRASYYDGDTASEEPVDTIGIFAPTAQWAAKATKASAATSKTPAAKKTQTLKVTVSKKTIKYSKLKKKKQTAKVTVKKAKGKVSYSKAKKTGKYKKVSISSKGKITFKKGAKKGTYKFKVKAKGTSTYKASKTYTVTVKVK